MTQKKLANFYLFSKNQVSDMCLSVTPRNHVSDTPNDQERDSTGTSNRHETPIFKITFLTHSFDSLVLRWFVGFVLHPSRLSSGGRRHTGDDRTSTWNSGRCSVVDGWPGRHVGDVNPVGDLGKSGWQVDSHSVYKDVRRRVDEVTSRGKEVEGVDRQS